MWSDPESNFIGGEDIPSWLRRGFLVREEPYAKFHFGAQGIIVRILVNKVQACSILKKL
jgi:hypothetical protein